MARKLIFATLLAAACGLIAVCAESIEMPGDEPSDGTTFVQPAEWGSRTASAGSGSAAAPSASTAPQIRARQPATAEVKPRILPASKLESDRLSQRYSTTPSEQLIAGRPPRASRQTITSHIADSGFAPAEDVSTTSEWAGNHGTANEPPLSLVSYEPAAYHSRKHVPTPDSSQHRTATDSQRIRIGSEYHDIPNIIGVASASPRESVQRTVSWSSRQDGVGAGSDEPIETLPVPVRQNVRPIPEFGRQESPVPPAPFVPGRSSAGQPSNMSVAPWRNAPRASDAPVEQVETLPIPSPQSSPQFPVPGAPQQAPIVHSRFNQPVSVSAGMTPPGMSGYRAAGECDAEAWIAPYRHRANQSGESAPVSAMAALQSLPGELPPGFEPWWDVAVRNAAERNSSVLPVNVDGLINSALLHSPQVREITVDPQIRRATLLGEHAAFDWTAFLESTFDDLNDPVGNELTTGNLDSRFTDRVYSGESGLRRKNTYGGDLTVSQRIGAQSNNSRYLLPNPQTTSRLELRYTQPLLNGAGVPVNTSRVILAQIDVNSSEDNVADELQAHLLRVTEAYWELYRARAAYYQRLKVIEGAEAILQTLEARRHVDTSERQVLRAQAAVAQRKSELARSVTSIRNAESRLRFLVNDPIMLQTGNAELTPLDPPISWRYPTTVSSSLNEALVNRPDISLAIRRMRAASVRMGVARNAVLPKLDLLVQTYVAGLANEGQTLRSFGNQFSEGRPGYTLGLNFELPVGNRAARAKQQQRQWEMTRAVSQFRATVESALTSVEIAVREVDTTYQEMVARHEAMRAAQTETLYLRDRFETLPGMADSATLLLEDLLDAQERLADEEAAFVKAQVDYSLSIIALRQESGTLLRQQPIVSSGNLQPGESSPTVRTAATDSETPNDVGTIGNPATPTDEQPAAVAPGTTEQRGSGTRQALFNGFQMKNFLSPDKPALFSSIQQTTFSDGGQSEAATGSAGTGSAGSASAGSVSPVTMSGTGPRISDPARLPQWSFDGTSAAQEPDPTASRAETPQAGPDGGGDRRGILQRMFQ